jgi:hypothetical protein
MYSRYRRAAIACLIFLVLAGSCLTTRPGGKAYADLPMLDLQIDESETVRWDTGNIRPGDSGLEPVNLRNTGKVTGYICLWISDLIDSEGANPESETGNNTEPGELSNYLYLDIMNEGMTFARLTGGGYTNVELPIGLTSFPGDINHAICIISPPLKTGQALELQWRWTLSPATCNDAQGDRATFSINYSLISSLPGGSGEISLPPESGEKRPSDNTTGEPAPVPEITSPPASDNMTPSTGLYVQERTFMSDDGRCKLCISEGVPVLTDSGNELTNIIIGTRNDSPSVPGVIGYHSPVYGFRCITIDGTTGATQLSRKVLLTIYFDTHTQLGDTAFYIYSHRPGSGWVRLDCFGDPSRGWLSAWIDYLDRVTVMELRIENGEPYTTLGTPPMPETEAVVDDVFALRQVSLGIALGGVAAMTALAYIQRQRRNHRGREKTR